MLKRKNVTIPFYMDPWFWVKIIVFVIFLLFYHCERDIKVLESKGGNR